jgi:hypothetical protein
MRCLSINPVLPGIHGGCKVTGGENRSEQERTDQRCKMEIEMPSFYPAKHLLLAFLLLWSNACHEELKRKKDLICSLFLSMMVGRM